MNDYVVCKSIDDDNQTYYFIRCQEDMSILEEPTKYLLHLIRAHKSPNTIRRVAYSLSYYFSFAEQNGIRVKEVFSLSYEKQHEHFTDFLGWLKQARHNTKEKKNIPSNGTCNIYLRDVFGFYQFLELEYVQYGELKVLENRTLSMVNAVGVRCSKMIRSFSSYLKSEEHIGKTIEQSIIITLLQECANCRDQLLLLLLAETGYRIGELLGVRYTTDIDYKTHSVRVCFRENNPNGARAKNAEYRTAVISPDTYEILMYYLSKYRELLRKTDYLFVNLSGDTSGQPLNVAAVYAMLGRLEKKTRVKATPHMLRHYFANERYKNGWDLPLISKALGHRHIETTILYLNIGADELAEASDEYYKKNGSIFMADKLL